MPRAAGLGVEVLTGRTKGREREEILERIASGEAQIIIGTHALFQDSVNYQNLMLAVVDEQHRFGVHQRLRLTAKGISPHMLVMTATPIPRTLVLAAFGDMDVSKLTEKPAGRKPIQTITVPTERIGEIVGRLKSAHWRRARRPTGSARWSRNPKSCDLMSVGGAACDAGLGARSAASA